MPVTRRFVLAGAGAACAVSAGCAQYHSVKTWVDSNPLKPDDPSAQLKSALDKFAVACLKESPDDATSLGVSEAQAGGRFNNRLEDASSTGLERRASVMANTLTDLSRIDHAHLAGQDLISYDVVNEALSECLAGARFGWGDYGFDPPQPYVVSQINGAYIDTPSFLDSKHRIRAAQDVADYLERLSAFAVVLDQETDRIKADAGKGIAPPDFVLDGAIKQLSGLASEKPETSLLVLSLKRRLGDAQGMSAGQSKTAIASAASIVAGKVLPAMRRQIDALKTLRKTASHDAGVWRLKQGEEFYAVALRGWTTSALSPAEIHRMGLDILKAANAQMDAILKDHGLINGPIAERVARIAKEKAQLYPNTDEGRAAILADLNAQTAALQPLLPRYFATLAKAKLEIQRVPPYREAGAPPGYYERGSLDGTRPGTYYINLRNTAEWPRFKLPTLNYHEGEPGHHWQRSIAQENADLPLVRSALLGFPGYAEGWALYAEMLADEMGCYKDNQIARLGYLQAAAFRAARLVVDTGMHSERWSREKCIDFMVEATGDERSTLTTEVERYAARPGQACAYMVGRESIRKLREDAKTALGEKFDIKAFHDVVLKNGAMPLGVLATTVKTWITAQTAPPQPTKA